MEFDNDRPLKGVRPAEVIGWAALAVFYPLVNGLSAFPARPAFWLALLFFHGLSLLLYIAYSKWIVPRWWFGGSPGWFAAFTLLLWITVWLLLQAEYYVMRDNQVSHGYFFFSWSTILRETCWMLFHSFAAAAIAWLRRELDRRENLAELQTDNDYYKLRYLRSQLNPHFLFNTLNSIYALSLSKSDKTPDVIVRLSDIMRFLLYECNEDKIPIEKEIEFIRNYIELERIRYDADIRFTVEGETAGVRIEPFLFISFIENGFKHAVDNSQERPFIYITIKIMRHQVALNVINNTGLALETQAKRIQGKGLETSRNVLELLYPEAYALDIIQTEKKERKDSRMRLKNAHERLERLYPDTHTLDVLLNNNTFTVSLIVNTDTSDKMHHHRR